MYDAIVVGGGIVGMSTAYHLVRDGAQVLLVDREEIGKATAAGAGILSPESSANESDTWFDLASDAVEYYPKLAAELHVQGASDIGYAPMEQLIVAVSEDEEAAFAGLHKRMLARMARRGRNAADDLEMIESDAAQRLFPALASVRHALRFRRAGRIDGRLITAAMREVAIRQGLDVRTANATQLAMNGGQVTGVVVAKGEMLSGGAVVIAGGAWSSEFAAQLGIALPIQPQRGQIIHLSLSNTDTSRLPIVTAFHGHYILPFADQRIVVGATRELVGFAPHTTAAGIREVLSEALRVAPGLGDAAIGEIRVGLRPVSPDQLPVLGRVPTARNVFIATGHGATGLQLGPYSGKLIANLVQGKGNEKRLEPFRVERFQ